MQDTFNKSCKTYCQKEIPYGSPNTDLNQKQFSGKELKYWVWPKQMMHDALNTECSLKC